MDKHRPLHSVLLPLLPQRPFHSASLLHSRLEECLEPLQLHLLLVHLLLHLLLAQHLPSANSLPLLDSVL